MGIGQFFEQFEDPELPDIKFDFKRKRRATDTILVLNSDVSYSI